VSYSLARPRVARWHILKPKIQILGKFLGDLQWNMLVFYGHVAYFTVIWSLGLSLWPFGIFYGYLVYFSPVFGMLYQEKSGNPGQPRNQQQRLGGQTGFFHTTN
jgi:hypothetical protein